MGWGRFAEFSFLHVTNEIRPQSQPPRKNKDRKSLCTFTGPPRQTTDRRCWRCCDGVTVLSSETAASVVRLIPRSSISHS